MANRKYTDEDLIIAFNNSSSITEISRRLGCAIGGRTNNRIRKECENLGLDVKSKTKKIGKRKYSDALLIQQFPEATSLADLCRKLGLAQSGNSLVGLRKRCEHLNLDWVNKKKQGWSKGVKRNYENRLKYSDDEVFQKNSPYLGGSTALKKRAKELGYLKDYCEICGQSNIWNGKELCLIIDHIDGDNKNNDPSNLRSVCPNCDIQLPTSRGKNKGKN